MTQLFSHDQDASDERTEDYQREDQSQNLQQNTCEDKSAKLVLSDTLSPGLTSGLYPQFILFGDSITQFGQDEIQPALQKLYARRMDIVNRGLSGYTSTMALQTIPHFLPCTYPAPQPWNPQFPIPPIKLMTVFFGANDACLPGNSQHLPLKEYVTSLRRIINYKVLKRHGTKVIIIVPPPVNEHQMGKPLTRKAWHTACYAQAARNLGRELRIPCVDIWSAFLRETGPAYQDPLPPPPSYQFSEDDDSRIPGSIELPLNDCLQALLVDGLHLTSRGYEILYNELVRTIESELPDFAAQHLPSVYKEWEDCFGGK